MSFKGLDEVGLCELMHRSFRHANKFPNEESFMGHMIDDNASVHPDTKVPAFIEMGLQGTRAFTLKNLEPDVPEPPPGWDHARLIAVAHPWVEAMRGRFHGDTLCGCKKQEYSLRLDYKSNLNLNFGVLTGQYITATKGQSPKGLEIPLKATEPGVFKGEGLMRPGGHGYISSMVGTCVGRGEQSFQVRATATMEEGDEESRGKKDQLHVRFECQRVQEQASGACPQASGSQSGFNPCDASGVRADFAPASVDAPKSQRFPSPFPNSEIGLTSTIVKK